MRQFLLRGAAVAAVFLGLATPAHAIGGHYDVLGGTPRERAQVHAALEASRFDWSVVPRRITINIAAGVDSHALPGQIWLDRDLLAAGIFSWAVIQDEYAHQIDYLLFDEAVRARLNMALGGKAWCHGQRPGLSHAEYGCERFASTLVWSFWPSRSNAYRPKTPRDESAAMQPARFRALLGSLLAEHALAPVAV